MDQPCEMNEQCVKYDNNAFCNGGVCRCLENFAKHDNACRSLVKIGEQCRSDEECRKFTTNVTCFDHKCACEKSFVASTDGNVSETRDDLDCLLIIRSLLEMLAHHIPP